MHMDIIVCIKYIPSSSSIDCTYSMNPYDLYVLRQAILFKRHYPKASITAVTMAPKSAVGMLKDAVAVGCDAAVLVTDNDFAGADTLATSYVLSKAIEHIGMPHLILCGEKSIDGETGFVSIALSYRLNYAYAPNIVEIVAVEGETVHAHTLDTRYQNTIAITMPSVLSFDKALLTGITSSLCQQKKASFYKPLVLTNDDLKIDVSLCGLNGSSTNVLKVSDVASSKRTDPVAVYGVDAGISRIVDELGGMSM